MSVEERLDAHLMRFTGCEIGPALARAMEREIRRFMILAGIWPFNVHAVLTDECKFVDAVERPTRPAATRLRALPSPHRPAQ